MSTFYKTTQVIKNKLQEDLFLDEVQPTKKQHRGIDITVKALSKKYPFVKGWREGKSWLTYNTMINIDLLVNFFELSDLTGLRMNDFWKRTLSTNERDETTYALGGYFDYPKDDTTMYDIRVRLEKDLERLYTNLPQDMRVMWDFRSSLSKETDPPTPSPRRLALDNFVSVT